MTSFGWLLLTKTFVRQRKTLLYHVRIFMKDVAVTLFLPSCHLLYMRRRIPLQHRTFPHVRKESLGNPRKRNERRLHYSGLDFAIDHSFSLCTSVVDALLCCSARSWVRIPCMHTSKAEATLPKVLVFGFPTLLTLKSRIHEYLWRMQFCTWFVQFFSLHSSIPIYT